METVKGKQVTILFEGKKCIHSRNCVLSRPDVFVPNVEGEWIYPDQASPEEIRALALNCPSGAIRFEPEDPKFSEKAPPINVVRIRENGPLAFHADMELEGSGNEYRLTLCRCGASKNKPFCDSSHVEIGFTATGEPPVQESEPLPVRNGKLAIKPTKNGPLHVTGNLEVCSGTGKVTNRITDGYLCRCGGSSNKPYCDGTHRKIGFKS
ncbi:iron-binding protein [Leptospira langatensis]|uniref:Iron-binding protein n=1 Tax=Leptospira langatensis TaxID=2484983 RepID=A0A5F1ZQU5_9LEPT|nr:CDGSH iron-sulfur domain-containing protein [Leptospira langatensis]TGK05264.1 iron-binding protein [Leptospira langatensis]TGL38400.1 iron-binding protein [Leptospira langatensis]